MLRCSKQNVENDIEKGNIQPVDGGHAGHQSVGHTLRYVNNSDLLKQIGALGNNKRNAKNVVITDSYG
jgi:hypothetical protein